MVLTVRYKVGSNKVCDSRYYLGRVCLFVRCLLAFSLVSFLLRRCVRFVCNVQEKKKTKNKNKQTKKKIVKYFKYLPLVFV